MKKIYVSSLGRAIETAEEVSQSIKIPLTIKNELKEICYGDFEGKTREEMQKLPIWNQRKHNLFQFIHPGKYLGISGESYEMLYIRLLPFFQKLQYEKVPAVIIAHLGVLRCAKKFYNKENDEDLGNFKEPNNVVYVVDKEKGHVITL